MMTSAYVPSKGDIVWLEFSPQAGNEQSGHRPALCVSPREYNERVGLALFCPITGRKKGYPFEVELPELLEITGVVLADHVKNLDWQARNVKYVCAIGPKQLSEVIAKLKALL